MSTVSTDRQHEQTPEQQLAACKDLLAEILGTLGSAAGYIPSFGHPLTRKIQRHLAGLGVTEIIYQPGSWLAKKGPVLPPPGQ